MSEVLLYTGFTNLFSDMIPKDTKPLGALGYRFGCFHRASAPAPSTSSSAQICGVLFLRAAGLVGFPTGDSNSLSARVLLESSNSRSTWKGKHHKSHTADFQGISPMPQT